MLRCAARSGFKFSLEEVALEAGLSRATVYRYFPEGRDQLINDGVAWEVANFFTTVGLAVQERDDLAGKIEEALIVGRRQLRGHAVLQQILSVDAEQLVVHLEGPIERVEDGIVGYVTSLLEVAELADGRVAGEAPQHKPPRKM
jgi:AcrR family transcriptional regulator